MKKEKVTVKETSEKTETNSSEIIADILRSETEIIRVSTRKYKGIEYVDLRVFFKDKQTDEYRPTKKGLTIKKDQIHEVAKAVCLAEEAIVAQLENLIAGGKGRGVVV